MSRRRTSRHSRHYRRSMMPNAVLVPNMLSSQPFDLKERCDGFVNTAKMWLNEYKMGRSLNELVVAVFWLGRAGEVLRELKALDYAADETHEFDRIGIWPGMRQRLVDSVSPSDMAQIRDLYYAAADFYNNTCYEIQAALQESGAGGYSFNHK